MPGPSWLPCITRRKRTRSKRCFLFIPARSTSALTNHRKDEDNPDAKSRRARNGGGYRATGLCPRGERHGVRRAENRLLRRQFLQARGLQRVCLQRQSCGHKRDRRTRQAQTRPLCRDPTCYPLVLPALPLGLALCNRLLFHDTPPSSCCLLFSFRGFWPLVISTVRPTNQRR